MARKRIEGTRLVNFDQVDETLCRIGVIDRELALIAAWANDQIDRIKEEAKEKSATLAEKKAAHERDLKEFCEANRAEFTKVKTIRLTFGSVGFRFSSRIVIKRIADTLQALRELGLEKCIRTKEEPDKDRMKDLPDATLAAVGACRKTEDVFGYEIDRARIAEEA
jgi:phage host-nuclease inhibitor protein Gam